MRLYPAIDMKDGKCVRLRQGVFEDKTVYAEEPYKVAMAFEAAGAKFLHLVDLDGALLGVGANDEALKQIVAHVTIPVEIGGGIRSFITIEKYLTAGAERIILGTAAITKPDFLRECVKIFGDAIAVGVDVRDGLVAIKGWTETSDQELIPFCKKMEQIGVKTLICTDISRDGAMKGTNRALYGELSKECGVDIVASGGVSTMEDVKALADLGLYGAIIGKAYYIGAIDLREAVEEAKR